MTATVEEVADMFDKMNLESGKLCDNAGDSENLDFNVIPEMAEDERKILDEEISKRAPPLPGAVAAVDFPLHDIVIEKGLDKPAEGTNRQFYEDLKKKDAKSIYSKLKDIPDPIARKYLPDLARRFVEFERRVKRMERMLWALPREDRSLEEDRFEILTEVLDKACQGMEIWEEHCDRNIRIGHRCYLEGQLIHLIDSKFDLIEKICKEFHKLKGKQDETNNERDMLRYEIRNCDMVFTEIHENFLKSYLDMEW